MMRRWIAPWAAGAAAVVIAASASAQPAAPTQVRGAVTSLEGSTLVVASPSGPTTVMLDPNWTVNVLKKIDVASIQPGSFIGTTNKDNADGTGTSTEIHVFPPGVRLGEGHYPWRGESGTMMTNGDVTMVVTGAKGRELTIKYNGQGGQGERKVTVPADIPIVTFSQGDHSVIKPGANVLIFAAKGPDGMLHANGVTTGENGAAPPM